MSRKSSLLFVFDFDGTLADTLNPLVDIYNTVIAPEYKCAPVSAADRERLRGMNPRSLIKAYRVPLYKIPFMVRRARRELFRRIDTVSPHKDIVSTLHGLNQAEFITGILTSNSRENVRRFLQHWGLEKCVHFIHTGLNVFGKARQLRNIMKKMKICPAELVYVGDETRDVEAAQKAGVHSAAVAWGFNTPEILEKSKPERMIYHAAELVEWGKTLQSGSEAEPKRNRKAKPGS